MKIFEQIKNEVSVLDTNKQIEHLTKEEKINLPYVIMYHMAKNMPYFGDRYEVLRLASVEDEDIKNTLSFGHMSLNNINLHTNGNSGNFIFDDPWGESLKEYLLTEKDINLLNKTLNIIESSSDLDELIYKIDKEVETNPDFLYHYSYLMKDKIEILGYNGSDLILDTIIYLDKNKHENNDMVKKYKKKIYFNSVRQSPVDELLDRSLKDILYGGNIESEMNRMYSERGINIKELNPLDLNVPEMIMLRNRDKGSSEIKKILFNEKIFKKSKFKSKILIKNKLVQKNENEVLKKFEKEIEKVVNIIVNSHKILENDENIDYEVKLHKNDEKNQFIIEGSLNEETWSLGDWDKDKGLAGYQFSSQEYTERKKTFSQEMISVGNTLENVAFIQFTKENDVIKWRVADCGKDDPKIMSLVLDELKKYSQKHNINAINLDILNDNEDNIKNDFRKDVILNFIKKDKSDMVYFQTSGGLVDYEKNKVFLNKYGLYDWEYRNDTKVFSEHFDFDKRKEMKDYYKEIIEMDLDTAKEINKKNRRKKLGLTL